MSTDRERRGREGGGAHDDAVHDDAAPDLAQSIRTDPAHRARYMRWKARKAANAAKNPAAPVPGTTGSALPEAVRDRMEPHLGADLSGVRVHAGGESAHAADQLGARAFTVGNDVHFGAGQFSPNTKEGDKLIAHELTHVVQGQKSGVQRKAESDEHAADGAEADEQVSQPHEPAEQEADAVADHVGEQLHGDGGGQQHAADAPGSTPTADSSTAPAATGGKKIARKAGPLQPLPAVSGGRKFLKRDEKNKKDTAPEHGKRDIDRKPGGGASPADWVHYLSDLHAFMRDQAGAEKEQLLDIRAHREEHPVVGAISEAAASVKARENVKVPDEGIWDAVFAQLNKAHALAAGDKPDIEGAKREMATAVRMFEDAHKRVYEYRSRTEGGAQMAATTLRGIEIGCDITLTVLSAGIGVEGNLLKMGARGAFKAIAKQAGKSLVKTAAKVGAVSGANHLADGGAEEGVGKAIGADSEFDVAKVLREAGEAAVMNFLGVLIGGSLSKVFMRQLGEILGSRMAPEGLLALAEKYGIEGAIPPELFVSKGWRFLVGVAGDACTTTLLTALSTLVEQLRSGGKRPTGEQFVQMVITQMIQNGLLQVVLTAVTHERAASAGKTKIPRAGSDSTATDAQGKESPTGAGGPSASGDANANVGPQSGPKQHTPESASAEKTTTATSHADSAKPDAAKQIAELRSQVSTEAHAGLDFLVKEKGPERALADIERWKQEGHNADSRLRDYAVVAWAKGLMNSTPPEEKDPAVLAKKKAEYGERQELNRELYAAVMRGEKEPPPGITREQLRDAVEGDKTGERVPLSFGEKNLYEEFKADVMKTLSDIGVTDATVQAVGSQAQGFTGNPKKPAGKPFQPGKSDADFAINSVQLLHMAKQAGVPLNPKVVLDGKYYVLKNETPQGTGFYQTVGKRFAALAAKWNERVYGDPNVDGFDFKMNLAVEPFENAINVARPRKDKK